jgi:hypothetical protein
VDLAAVDGVQVRNGSISASVANAKTLATLDPDTPEYDEVVTQLRVLSPALTAVAYLTSSNYVRPELREDYG